MSRNVIVVDDDLNTRVLVKVNLEQKGFSVSAYANGMDALRHLETEQPEVIIVDLLMPGMSGLELISMIRRRFNTPILVVTAHSDKHELREQALLAGANNYMLKPFQRSDLIENVSRMVDGKANASATS
ncbi:MAG: response regulator [Burkholderiales bacterium]|nr:response regulator [Anaerolineae bacterium]